jgi:hypothetical protein
VCHFQEVSPTSGHPRSGLVFFSHPSITVAHRATDASRVPRVMPARLRQCGARGHPGIGLPVAPPTVCAECCSQVNRQPSTLSAHQHIARWPTLAAAAERVKFKMVTLTYSCLHGTAPCYLSALLRRVANVSTHRRLQSASRDTFLVHLTLAIMLFRSLQQNRGTSFPAISLPSNH